jgi:hypothetical protein
MDVKSYCLGDKLLIGHGSIINIVFTQTPTLGFGCVSPKQIHLHKTSLFFKLVNYMIGFWIGVFRMLQRLPMKLQTYLHNCLQSFTTNINRYCSGKYWLLQHNSSIELQLS